MTTTSTDRLARLLALVPYVVSRRSVSLAEAAEAFGVTEKQLIDDLNMLWCVELRAPDPYCPIDLSYEGGEITVTEAESIARPLRLGVDEASALLVALRMLTQIPGLRDRDALSRVIAKLENAAGAYLEGWCGRAEAVRLFRLDRIVELTILSVPAEVPDGAEPVDVDAGLFRASPDDVRVTL